MLINFWTFASTKVSSFWGFSWFGLLYFIVYAFFGYSSELDENSRSLIFKARFAYFTIFLLPLPSKRNCFIYYYNICMLLSCFISSGLFPKERVCYFFSWVVSEYLLHIGLSFNLFPIFPIPKLVFSSLAGAWEGMRESI